MKYERKLLKVAEVAEVLGIGRSTVWAHVKSGKVPQPIKIGGATRWRQSEIEQLVAASLTFTTGEQDGSTGSVGH